MKSYAKSIATFMGICIVDMLFIFVYLLMRFVKRFIFLIVVLLVAFFVYRLISPTGAKALIYDLKSFANENIGTHFFLTGDVLISTSGTLLDMTGSVLEDTGILQEFSDDDLLLEDIDVSSETVVAPVVLEEEVSTGTSSSVIGTSSTVSQPSSSTTKTSTTKTTTPKTTTSSPSSSQTIRQAIVDLKAIFGQ